MVVELVVFDWYVLVVMEVELMFCCLVDYFEIDFFYILEEVIVKDYGCGNLVFYVFVGDMVFDFGFGGGKICFVMLKMVGLEG